MSEAPRRLLVLGANGMLGHAVLRWFAARPGYEVMGVLRRPEPASALAARVPGVQLLSGNDLRTAAEVRELLDETRPDVVVNCIGVVKQLAGAENPHIAIPVNALLPHRLARACMARGARLVHISTDCVFSGARGAYTEDDMPDAEDLYGRTKLIGEVDYANAITLRTSIIGHELQGGHALLGWFLGQTGPVPGFSRALFSALPTVELARVIEEHVLPRPELHGVFHVAGPTISKYELLKLVAAAYGRDNPIVPEAVPVIDRSLDASRFHAETGYVAPDWGEMVRRMHAFG